MKELLVTCSVLLFLIASSAQADVVVSGSIYPSDPSTWNSDTSVNIGNQAYGAATIDDDSDVYTKNCTIGNEAAGDGVATVTGNGTTCNVGIDLLVGNYGSGELNIADGGAVSVARYAFIGRRDDSSGEVYVSGSTLSVASGFNVGMAGSQGSLSVTNGGAVSSGGTFSIGDGAEALGTVLVSGSTFTQTGGFNVATTGEASLSITGGGTMTASATSQVGRDSTGDGTLEISGTGSALTLTSGNLYAGNSGTGAIEVSDSGMLSLNGMLALGYEAGSNGTLLVSDGGTVSLNSSSGDFHVGRMGTAEMNVLHGGKVINGYRSIIGGYPSGSGIITVSGEGSEWRMGDALIFNSGVGELTISDAGLVQVSGAVTIGNNDFLNISTGGMLAMAGINPTFTLEQWIFDVGNFGGLQWWNEDHWEPMYDIGSYTLNIPEEEYSFVYHSEGDFAGYTVLTVGTYVPPEEWTPGDANKDGKVDGSDVTILAGNWQHGVTPPSDATWEMGDFNGDGKVDGSDVTILAGNWQAGVEAAASAVPEPSTILMIFSAIAGLFVLRRSVVVTRRK